MISDYINYLRTIRGYSENTCSAYEKDLHDFAIWARQNLTDARWSAITRDDIDQYIETMVSNDLKPATTNRRLSSISGLYNYFRRQGHTIENPCKYESRRKIAETIPNTIPTGELKAAWEHSAGIVKSMLGLLASTGMRIQELLDMTWESIDFEESSIKIQGKGGKQRKVFTTPEHLEVLRTIATWGEQHGRVYKMEQRTARRMIFDALRPYSNAKQLSPHAIRHTMATNLANHGANVTTISKLLGHKHLATTQKYIDMTQADGRQLTLKYGLLN